MQHFRKVHFYKKTELLLVVLTAVVSLAAGRIAGDNLYGENVLYTNVTAPVQNGSTSDNPKEAAHELVEATDTGLYVNVSVGTIPTKEILDNGPPTTADPSYLANIAGTTETVPIMAIPNAATTLTSQLITGVTNSTIVELTTTSTVSSNVSSSANSAVTSITTTLPTTPATVTPAQAGPVTSSTTLRMPVLPTIECYHALPSLCNERRSDCECNIDPAVPGALYCCNVTDINKAIACVTNAPEAANWKYLHMRNVTVRELALNVSNRYLRTLHSLAITDGTIQRISTSFARFSTPVCVNISNNNISELEPRAFRELRHLTMLDLSFNNLSTIPSTNGKFRLDIRGNVGMLCKSLLESLKSGVKFKDPESTFCLTNRTFNWFNTTDSLQIHQLEMMQRVQDECPENCTCELDRLNFDLNNTERKTITARVDCSGLGLTKFPEKLPSGTVTLNVSSNNITSLEALNSAPYESLLRLHADDNQIGSLSDLEGMDFISRFTLFSIRRNKLKTVQSYIFTKSLDLGSYIFLEGNPMTCDCNAAKGFKNWLLSRKAQVPDHENIFCEGDTSLQQLVTIQESKLCQSQHDWTDYIYYLIAAEIILLIALVCKVSYDYWIFKSAGYLPWPANKMPKLPCDCLCE
ncbi:protein halfway-like isoform X2 [Anopheles albimanus]|uniref:protein halfway-like isoform X2 n=1 Tax=Anopheles albimanus TaxID=7167 RepID=UPI0016405231|nr:protein halfway-like isoform X2 [Anopheles albimanus]